MSILTDVAGKDHRFCDFCGAHDKLRRYLLEGGVFHKLHVCELCVGEMVRRLPDEKANRENSEGNRT